MTDRTPVRLATALAKLGQAKLSEFGAGLGERLDGWTNNLTGFGTSRDKTTYGRFLRRQPLDVETLSDLYHFSDMAARMVDVVPQEMFREGFRISTEDKDVTETINDKHDELNTRQRFVEAERWGRLFGGGAILIGANDGRSADRPLTPERAQDIAWLMAMDRRVLWPLTYYRDEGTAQFGKVETYMITPVGGHVTRETKVVHESRLIMFGGAPTADQEKLENSGWDFSVLQRPHDVLRQFDTSWTAVENLLVDGHQAVYKMSGLAQAIAADDKEYLTKRAQLLDMARSVVRAMVIDAGDPGAQEASEEFIRNSVSFADIPATLDKIMLRLAAAVQIPVTLLMGQSPAGMNATGESDFRGFYDRIRADQMHRMAPKLRQLTDIWLRTKAGQEAARSKEVVVKVDFPSLWSESPLIQAQTRLAVAQGDAAYVAAGVYLPEEVGLARSPTEPGDLDIPMTDSSRKSREQIVKDDMERLESGERDDDGSTTQTPPTAPPTFPG
jgi:uncharacterized protein